MLDRRTMIASAAALAASSPALGRAAKAAKAAAAPTFPQGFLWGASTAPHQIEGNNTGSDLWFIENQQPTVFVTPSGDAANSLLLWEQDLDLAKGMGLNTYRFGIEWARIEPEKGLFSQAMLDHYARVIDGCRARGLAPVVTFSHFTAPRWFSAQGGWANPESASLFARFADKAARHFADRIHAAITFNEPNILLLLQNANVPPQLWDIQKLTLETAASAWACRASSAPTWRARTICPICNAGCSPRTRPARRRSRRPRPACRWASRWR
jgi:beta-glucosidase